MLQQQCLSLCDSESVSTLTTATNKKRGSGPLKLAQEKINEILMSITESVGPFPYWKCKRLKADIWPYYQIFKIDNAPKSHYAVCRLCATQNNRRFTYFGMDGSTGTGRRHLKSAHGSLYCRTIPSQKATALSQNNIGSTQGTSRVDRSVGINAMAVSDKALRDALHKLIVLKKLPITVTGDEDWTEFLRLSWSSYEPHSIGACW